MGPLYSIDEFLGHLLNEQKKRVIFGPLESDWTFTSRIHRSIESLNFSPGVRSKGLGGLWAHGRGRGTPGRHGTTWDDSLARSHGAYVWLPVLPQWSPWPVFKMFQWFFGALRCTNWTPQFVRWLAGHVPKREVFGMGSVHWFGWSTRRHGAEVAPFSPMQHGGFQRHHLDVNLKAQSTMLPRPMTTFCTTWICRKWRPRGDIPVASRGYPIQYFTWYPQWKHYFEPTNWVGSGQLKATSTLCGCQSLINAYWEVEF